MNEGSLSTFGNVTHVQTLTEALMLLSSGRVDAMWCMCPTAEYIAARNPGLLAVRGVYPFSMRMLAPSDRQDLADALDRAIEGMTQDGTMETLWDAHVEPLLRGEGEPAPVEMPNNENGLALRVGVSGDMPPMDYVSASGTPSGFNTAVLSEIAERENLSIELVQIDSGARFSALASGRIDLFFWQTRMEGLTEENYAGDVESYADTEEKAIPCLTTKPYWVMDAGWLIVNPNAD